MLTKNVKEKMYNFLEAKLDPSIDLLFIISSVTILYVFSIIQHLSSIPNENLLILFLSCIYLAFFYSAKILMIKFFMTHHFRKKNYISSDHRNSPHIKSDLIKQTIVYIIMIIYVYKSSIFFTQVVYEAIDQTAKGM